MLFVLILFFIIALIVEVLFVPLPLVLICLLFWLFIRRDASVFPLAFFAGLVLDMFAIRTLGLTSLFFLLFVFLMLLYQRKYEIRSYQFVAVASFLGSVIFFAWVGFGFAFEQAVITALIAVVLFLILKKML
jgi:hypothetical protein